MLFVFWIPKICFINFRRNQYLYIQGQTQPEITNDQDDASAKAAAKRKGKVAKTDNAEKAEKAEKAEPAAKGGNNESAGGLDLEALLNDARKSLGGNDDAKNVD